MPGVDVVIIVPILGRPHRVAPFLKSLAKATPEPHRVVMVGTRTDTKMLAEARKHPDVELLVMRPAYIGDYARKINFAYRHTTEPLMFLAADDLNFHDGWLPAAVAEMRGPIGVVGTQDLAHTDRARDGEHSTHSLVARAYIDECGTIDEPGKVLHEGYPHEFVDDEFVETAKARGAWAFAAGSVVEHLHPSWGKAPADAIYSRMHDRMRIGRRIFMQRRQLWDTTSRS
jgi:hypothetical protein